MPRVPAPPLPPAPAATEAARTLGDLLLARAAATPHGVFWEEDGERLTWAALAHRAQAVAQALLRHGHGAGAGPGRHIALCSGNRVDYAVLHFGAALAGCVLVHLNARYTAPELAALLAHGDAVLLFCDAPRLSTAAQALEGNPALPLLEGVVCLDPLPAPAPAVARPLTTLPDWLAAGAGPSLPLPALDPDAPFQLLYTSGTTGQPKGALLSHRAKLAQGRTHARNGDLRPGDRVLSALPLYHQFAQWLALVCLPLVGASLVARPAFDAGDWWAVLRSDSITHLPAVPTMLYRLLEHPAAAGPRPPSLRQIIYGGAPIAPERLPALRRTFPGVRLFQGLGQTESGALTVLADADHEAHGQSVGRADALAELRLLDEAGQPVPDGAVGEIVARSPMLMTEYYKNPEATAAYFAFGPDWGRTGDLATRDADGFYTLAGRRSELILSGGVNVYPAEIEAVLRAHPAVDDAAVHGLPHPDWGEQVAATLVLHPDHALDEALRTALDAWCRERLAGFKVPRHWAALDELPRTASGKVQKWKLAQKGPRVDAG